MGCRPVAEVIMRVHKYELMMSLYIINMYTLSQRMATKEYNKTTQ